MKSMKTASGAFVLASALLLTGCSGGSSDDKGDDSKKTTNTSLQKSYNEQPASALKDGGTYTTATTEVSPQFNPFQQDGTRYTSDVWRWYNPVLKTYSADGSKVIWNKAYIERAKSEVKGDKLVVTYTMNPKAKYNDGSPIDWKSFENTWKANSGKDKAFLPSSTDGFSAIESVAKGKDDHEAVITFNQPGVWWEGLFDFLLNPKVSSADQFNKFYLNNPHAELGAGPYKIEKYDSKAGTISFVRNEKWWGDKGKLDKRTFITMEASASINAFKNGQIDATSARTKDRLQQVKDVPNTELRRGSYPSNSLLTLNGKSPLLADKAVRKAIMEGVDRSKLAEIEFNGLDYKEELPGSFLLFSFQKGYENNVSTKFDAEQAKKDLDAAGWKAGSDGVRSKDGKKLTLSYVNLGDDPVNKAQATAMQAMLKGIGVDMKIDQRASSEFSNVITKKDFDLFPMGFSSSDPYGVAYACQVWCSDSGLNQSGVADKSLDPKFKDLTKIGDKDKQIAEANKLEKQAMDQYGILPLTNGPVIMATKKGLANVGASVFSFPFPETIGWQK